MQGEFIGIWTETWREIWEPLTLQEVAPFDVFCELYRELSSALKDKPTIESVADILDDPEESKKAFLKIRDVEIAGEKALVAFFERTHENLYELAGDALANEYFTLLATFVDKYSLRYDLRRPCTLCPTLQGVFSSLLRDLRAATGKSTHLDSLMKDFENAVRDLRKDHSDGRIKTCIQKQVNLLEAIGRACPNITATTLGAICNQIDTWPHEKIREAIKDIYTFASDYPGIRHAGTPENAIRDIEMRDLIAMSVVLAGFTPYLSDNLDADKIYDGL
jgi:hypothetical protein